MADMVTLLNTIRAKASADYRNRVPEATRDNIALVGNPIIEYDTIKNEFLGALVNRIALTIVNARTARNTLSVLKKGTVPLGQDVQEIFVNMAKAEHFNPDSTDLLKMRKPDVKAAYYRRNREDKYVVTISDEMLTAAFVSYIKLEEMIEGIIRSMYSGDYRDEYIFTKNLVTDAVFNGLTKCEKIIRPTDKESCEEFLIKVRALSGKFEVPSSKYNVYKEYAETKGLVDPTPVETWTPVKNQIMLITIDALSRIGVKSLASAFQMEEAKFLTRVVKVDQFDDEGKIQAIICDESFFQIWDNLTRIKVFENGDNLTRTYFYHRWETLGVSPFANAVCLLTDYIAPSKIEADDITVTAGETAPVVVKYSPDNGVVDKTVSFEVKNTDPTDTTVYATVSDTGVVTGVAEGTTTITITSDATYDSGETPAETEITVTVEAAGE